MIADTNMRPREKSPEGRSEEKGLFSQATAFQVSHWVTLKIIFEKSGTSFLLASVMPSFFAIWLDSFYFLSLLFSRKKKESYFFLNIACGCISSDE